MSQSGKIRVGLCAMEKKVNSKPMKEILKGLEKASYIKLIIFSEKIILNEPIESWPVCDALISFYSHNFPLDKAIDYAKLRKPYLINDLESQKILLNRKKVYSVLQSHGIPVPNHIVVDREKQNCELIDLDDAIEVNGQVIHKPFVEKPLDAENHNIYIYFPSTAGGGCQKLFRKIGDRSSTYSSESSVRMKGSFIYEDFMPTDGTDVKQLIPYSLKNRIAYFSGNAYETTILSSPRNNSSSIKRFSIFKIYTVGDDYAHAEARKSPALDGKVERDHEGKEVRYPVILTLREKMMAKKVSLAVKQQICGFDLLRANGMSYVCDVNGFSFVKSSPKYYEDCAHILLMMITRHIAPQLFTPRIPLPTNTGNLVPTTSGSIMELRCVIGVIRHGDRTPKQKMKMEVKHEKFFQLFRKYSNERSSEVKLKKPKQLQEILDIVRDLLKESEKSVTVSNIIGEQRNKYLQLRNVLEMYGHFRGINRKIQMKYKPAINFKNNLLDHGNDSSGLLLIIKWGGELTKAGRLQAEKLGRAFRRLYPGCNGDYGNDSGLGLLRLHSTYRHDLKIYASDEGRVQMTAAAFAKGFLALEGELPPILAQMVKSANTNGLLDNDNDCRQYQIMVKKKIYNVLSLNKSLTKSDMHKVAQTNTPSLMSALKEINNPVKMCDSLLSYLINLNLHLNEYSVEERSSISLYHEETWELLLRRWSKLLKDFKPKDNYDLSKIPDIYDNIKYDIQHNPRILLHNESEDLFSCAKALADVIVPQEYGVTVDEKLVIGQRICTPLLRKILSDARYTDVDECTRLHAGYSKGVASPERFVRTRLYFTSESHLHALLNCIRYGDLANINVDEQWKPAMDYVNSVSELNYLSQIVIMIYEDPSHSSKLEKDRFHVEIHFSPGALTVLEDQIEGTGYRPQNMERSSVLSRTDSNVSLTPNSKVISRQSSISEKQDVKLQSADEEKDTGFNVKDLLSRLSRKKKIKVSNRESLSIKNNSSENTTHFDFENVKSLQADLKSTDLNEEESVTSVDSVSKFTVTPVQLLEADISVDFNDKNDNQSGFINKTNLGAESLRSKNTFLRKLSSTKDEEDENQEMNYLTYPSRDISILNYLFQRQRMERKGSTKTCATSRPLISTEVIMGAKHYSTGSIPHINMLPELSEDGARYKNIKDEMNVPSAPCVPEIYPLETLHNALNLDHLEKFLVKLVSQKLPTPSASPK